MKKVTYFTPLHVGACSITSLLAANIVHLWLQLISCYWKFNQNCPFPPGRNDIVSCNKSYPRRAFPSLHLARPILSRIWPLNLIKCHVQIFLNNSWRRVPMPPAGVAICLLGIVSSWRSNDRLASPKHRVDPSLTGNLLSNMKIRWPSAKYRLTDKTEVTNVLSRVHATH